MEKNSVMILQRCVSDLLLISAMLLLLSLVSVTNSELAAGETIGQWVWFDKTAIVAVVCILLGLLASLPKGYTAEFGYCLSIALMIWGGVEAIWGLRQLYGFAASGHSRYALTGSFFNPGPYAGYLAMVLPICVFHWRAQRFPWKDMDIRMKIEKCLSGGVGICILCVLPATLSRSAWLAAIVSCLWVYGLYSDWELRFQSMWYHNKRRAMKLTIGVMAALVLSGGLLFLLKPDSAKGRLFMWKISCQAVAESPLAGHDVGDFAGAYGEAQEKYFAKGNYEPWEEYVAGSPEYAFNEYLRVAVEWGLVVMVGLLLMVTVCLIVGVEDGNWGACGAVFSLLIFSFSSYPLHLPVFIVTFVGLLLACVIKKTWTNWKTWIVFAIGIGTIGLLRYNGDSRMLEACREWTNVRMLYRAGAYEAAEKEYEQLEPMLKERAAFLFEYGHCLNKQGKTKASTRILKQALKLSSDPMILNIIGKNCQQEGDYWAAEEWFFRSTHRLPGRIYPYYLLAKLYVEPGFYQPEKFEKMKQIVLTKEPKVPSTAIREMREELENMKVDNKNDETQTSSW